MRQPDVCRALLRRINSLTLGDFQKNNAIIQQISAEIAQIESRLIQQNVATAFFDKMLPLLLRLYLQTRHEESPPNYGRIVTAFLPSLQAHLLLYFYNNDANIKKLVQYDLVRFEALLELINRYVPDSERLQSILMGYLEKNCRVFVNEHFERLQQLFLGLPSWNFNPPPPTSLVRLHQALLDEFFRKKGSYLKQSVSNIGVVIVALSGISAEKKLQMRTACIEDVKKYPEKYTKFDIATTHTLLCHLLQGFSDAGSIGVNDEESQHSCALAPRLHLVPSLPAVDVPLEAEVVSEIPYSDETTHFFANFVKTHIKKYIKDWQKDIVALVNLFTDVNDKNTVIEGVNIYLSQKISYVTQKKLDNVKCLFNLLNSKFLAPSTAREQVEMSLARFISEHPESFFNRKTKAFLAAISVGKASNSLNSKEESEKKLRKPNLQPIDSSNKNKAAGTAAFLEVLSKFQHAVPKQLLQNKLVDYVLGRRWLLFKRLPKILRTPQDALNLLQLVADSPSQMMRMGYRLLTYCQRNGIKLKEALLGEHSHVTLRSVLNGYASCRKGLVEWLDYITMETPSHIITVLEELTHCENYVTLKEAIGYYLVSHLQRFICASDFNLGKFLTTLFEVMTPKLLLQVGLLDKLIKLIQANPSVAQQYQPLYTQLLHTQQLLLNNVPICSFNQAGIGVVGRSIVLPSSLASAANSSAVVQVLREEEVNEQAIGYEPDKPLFSDAIDVSAILGPGSLFAIVAPAPQVVTKTVMGALSAAPFQAPAPEWV